MKVHKKKLISGLTFLIVLAAIPFSVVLVKRVVKLISHGSGQLANIKVDCDTPLSEVKKPWKNLAQGGEESKPMLGPVVSPLKPLETEYIRLDHLYDFYPVVGRNQSGQLTFDWTGLDQAVNEVLAAGALPFLSLSYMPPEIAQDGNPTNLPKNWWEWQLVVQKTIEHYSGRSQRNLKNVYYEVWNEPDLFGNFKVYGSKNYLNLYFYAQEGAKQAKNVNKFKIGGPGTTALYQNWVEAMAEKKQTENWRLDFISWHHYDPNTDRLEREFADARLWLFEHLNDLGAIELIISEWGFDSEKNSIYDTKLAAIHAMSGAVKSINKIDRLFSFEVKDGKSPEGKKFYGGWGIFTHEDMGISKKPRFYAFEFLNQIQGNRLNISGQGSWVRAVATKQGNRYQLFLVNYDPRGKHQESIPITFESLENGKYLYTQDFFLKEPTTQLEQDITDGQYKRVFPMPANSAAIITLEKI